LSFLLHVEDQNKKKKLKREKKKSEDTGGKVNFTMSCEEKSSSLMVLNGYVCHFYLEVGVSETNSS